ncbi:hypothetical protein G4G93_09020 [Methylobacterium sp. DB0501]|nr:hypothetical protein [Methylobacterium sp. DB0501]
MDDILRELPTESAEHLDIVDAAIVRFDRDPTDRAVMRHVFRLLHTIKGTCGFPGPASGVSRVDGRLLVVLDVDALLAFGEPAPMAA